MAPAQAQGDGKALRTKKRRTPTTDERNTEQRKVSAQTRRERARAAKPEQQPQAILGRRPATAPSSVGGGRKGCVNEPRKENDRWSPRGCNSAGRIRAPQCSGARVRPGSESTAQSHWGLLGSRESLGMSARNETPDGIAPVHQGPGEAACSRPYPNIEDSKVAGRSCAQCRCEGRQRDTGGPGLRIVAMERGETDPREPVSSEGADRMTEASWETRMGR